MAFMTQELKATLSPSIKATMKKYGVKGTIGVKHHSTLVVNIKSGKLDIIGNYNNAMKGKRNSYGDEIHVVDSLDVNVYWYKDQFTGTTAKFLEELIAAMKGDSWFDESDIQTDYFRTAYYLDVNVGAWDKPYRVES